MVSSLGGVITRDTLLGRFRCAACLLSIRGATRADRLQNVSRSERSLVNLESIADVRHTNVRWFGHVCRMLMDNIVMQAYTHYFKKDSGREEEVTAERNAVNSAEWRG